MNFTYNKKNVSNNTKRIFDILQNNNSDDVSELIKESEVLTNNTNQLNRERVVVANQGSFGTVTVSKNINSRDNNNRNNNTNNNYYQNRNGNNNQTGFSRGVGGVSYNRGNQRPYQSNENRGNHNNNNYRDNNRGRDTRDNRGGFNSRGNYNYNNYNNNNNARNLNRNTRTIFETEESSYANDETVRKQIISYLYSMLQLHNFDYKILETEADLQYLNTTRYYMFPNYKGTPSFMIFIKFCEDYYTCIIDRTTLKYNKNLLDYNSVNILPVKVRVCEDIYLGTIMDGVLNTQHGSRPTFYIDDLLFLRGTNVCNSKIINKNINLTSYLERCYVDDESLSTVILKINKIYELAKIRELAEFIKDKRYIKGITFYPELAGVPGSSGTKLIYIERQNTMSSNSTYNTVAQISKESEDTENSSKSTEMLELEEKTCIFSMRYVSPDVFKLLLVNETNILEEIDIALIPTSASSKTWNKLFNKDTSKTISVLCKFDNNKKKWIPLEEVTDIDKEDITLSA
jgi:hypothetical protein